MIVGGILNRKAIGISHLPLLEDKPAGTRLFEMQMSGKTAMRFSKPQNSVLYTGCADMEDLVNLVLAYDKIVDYEAELELIGDPARILAEYLSGAHLPLDDMQTWNLAETFILVLSIAEYHGFSLSNAVALDPRLAQITWLDTAKSTRRADCARFKTLLDRFSRVLAKNVPVVLDRTTGTLANLHTLFSEGIIIPRKDFLPEITRARKAVGLDDMILPAVEADMHDKAFLSLLSWMRRQADKEFTSLVLNAHLMESSYLDIPLHVWEDDLPLVKYKYQRGATYLPRVSKSEAIREAFSVLIPEVYTQDMSDLLRVRNSTEFKNFRKEVDEVYRQVLNAPQDFADSGSISEYFKSKYLPELEHLALERRPKPVKVLMRKLVSAIHPVAALLIGGHEIYEEFRDKHKSWKFAVSTLELKCKLQTKLLP